MLYDIVIIGGGAAGMAAAIYARRYDLKTLVLYESLGGHVSEAHNVENYPGFLSIPGLELAEKFKMHAEKFGAEIRIGRVERVEKDSRGFCIVGDVAVCSAKTVLIATGTSTKRLQIKGEKEFAGKGVSFCATCDAPFFRKKTVAVVGGGDSALSAAMMLSDIAAKVYLIHRRNEFRAEPILVKTVRERKNVEILFGSVVDEIKGEKFVKSIIVKKAVGEGGKKEISLEGVFIEIGALPANVIVEGLGVKFDKGGFILVDSAQATNIPGVYAAGDITTGSNNFMQIVTAASEGAVAANSIYKYLSQHEKGTDDKQWSK